MSSSDEWSNTFDIGYNNNNKDIKKQGEKRSALSIKEVDENVGGSDPMRYPTLTGEAETNPLLSRKSSLSPSRSSTSSSSSSSSKISSTGDEESSVDGEGGEVMNGTSGATVEDRPKCTDVDPNEPSSGCISNFKALLNLINLGRFVNNSRNLLSDNSKVQLSTSPSPSSSVSSSSSSSINFSSSSASNRSSLTDSSTISSSPGEPRVVAKEKPPKITNVSGEILEGPAIFRKSRSKSSPNNILLNLNESECSEAKQCLNNPLVQEETGLGKDENESETILNSQLSKDQVAVTPKDNNTSVRHQDICEKETFRVQTLESVSTDNKDKTAEANTGIADKESSEIASEIGNDQTKVEGETDMATRNCNNGYNLMRDSKDSIGSLTTKHLLLDYLHGSDIFNKSHLLAPKSLKTYVPPSLSRYNDVPNSTYKSSGPVLLKDSLSAKTKSILSDNITVPPTSKYVKYANRVALRNAALNVPNFSKSLDEESLKTNGDPPPVKSGSGPSESVSEKQKSEKQQPTIEDDEEGHLVYKEGSTINDRYQILRTVGEGTFGKVAECLDLKERIRVALKIIKNVDRYRESAKLEINVLQKIKEKDPEGNNLCVLILDSFQYGGHVCISFTMLGLSVYDFLKDNAYQPYPMEQVQHISYQLCQAVKFLHEMKLTHTDLKPENILFVCSDYEIIPCNQSIKRKKKLDYKKVLNTEIRLIDFGSATFDHEHHSSVISTRHYRAPEVLLDIGWYQPCDIWSIGCIMFELYTGFTLFQTHEDKEHLAMMERILGSLPYRMTKRSKTGYFWHGRLEWDYHSLAGKYVRETCRPLYRYLMADNENDRHLFDLVERMLEYEPAQRLPLADALMHPFLSKVKKRDSA